MINKVKFMIDSNQRNDGKHLVKVISSSYTKPRTSMQAWRVQNVKELIKKRIL